MLKLTFLEIGVAKGVVNDFILDKEFDFKVYMGMIVCVWSLEIHVIVILFFNGMKIGGLSSGFGGNLMVSCVLVVYFSIVVDVLKLVIVYEIGYFFGLIYFHVQFQEKSVEVLVIIDIVIKNL